MPKIYLSPSSQANNMYYDNSGSEEYYMNLIADALVPYLISNGIEFTRNNTSMTAKDSIIASNSDNYDLHIALHSNAAPGARAGMVQGSDVFYYPTSKEGRRLARIVADNLKVIYPNPNLVKTVPSVDIGEVRLTNAPSVLIEFAFHDNKEDAEWIKSNIDIIARNLALSITEYFGLPFAEPVNPQQATVKLRFGRLNVRSRPSVMSTIIGTLKDGDKILIIGKLDNWYVISYDGKTAYVRNTYIEL